MVWFYDLVGFRVVEVAGFLWFCWWWFCGINGGFGEVVWWGWWFAIVFFRMYRRLGLLSILLCCVVWVIGCLGLKVSGMVVGWLLGLLTAWVVLWGRLVLLLCGLRVEWLWACWMFYGDLI